MNNPYFLNPRSANVEVNVGDDNNIYEATIFDRPNGRKAVELKFHTEENYMDFATKIIYKVSGKRLRMYLLHKIAGSHVIEKNEIIGELLSHNSDYYKATYLFD